MQRCGFVTKGLLGCTKNHFNPLWSNTRKQFVYLVGLGLKELIYLRKFLSLLIYLPFP